MQLLLVREVVHQFWILLCLLEHTLHWDVFILGTVDFQVLIRFYTYRGIIKSLESLTLFLAGNEFLEEVGRHWIRMIRQIGLAVMLEQHEPFSLRAHLRFCAFRIHLNGLKRFRRVDIHLGSFFLVTVKIIEAIILIWITPSYKEGKLLITNDQTANTWRRRGCYDASTWWSSTLGSTPLAWRPGRWRLRSS